MRAIWAAEEQARQRDPQDCLTEIMAKRWRQ